MYKDSGVPSVGLSIIANDALLTSDPKTVKAFVDASLRGWEAARKDPEAAAKAVADQFPQAGKAPSFVKQLKVDMPLMCAASATTLGTVPAKNWTTTYDLLTKYQGLPKTKPIEEYYTNDFLPKSAPAC
jgi:NitT/TauT family transport system substrate-binding protein